MRRALIVSAFAFAAAACAGRNQATQRRSTSNVVTQEEIATASVNTAYEALDRLRPRFLRPQPRSAAGGGLKLATVFIDGVRRGTPEILRSVAAATVKEIRYLTASDATTRYGLNIDGGVIDVRLIQP